MKATKPIKAGEQIFNDYGPLPRSDLLRMYGYVTDNYAQYDVVEFSHDILVDVAGMRDPSNNKAWLRREEQLDEIGIVDDGYSLPRPPKDAKLEEYLPGNVHMVLRGLCLNSSSTKMLTMKDSESISIEEAALLSAVATKKLSEYPTSVEDDELMWQRRLHDGTGGANLGKRMQLALQVRIGEKEILHALINLCQTHVAAKTKEIATNDKKRKMSNGDDTRTSKKATKRRP